MCLQGEAETKQGFCCIIFDCPEIIQTASFFLSCSDRRQFDFVNSLLWISTIQKPGGIDACNMHSWDVMSICNSVHHSRRTVIVPLTLIIVILNLFGSWTCDFSLTPMTTYESNFLNWFSRETIPRMWYGFKRNSPSAIVRLFALHLIVVQPPSEVHWRDMSWIVRGLKREIRDLLICSATFPFFTFLTSPCNGSMPGFTFEV
jgi:hypothetical protein